MKRRLKSTRHHIRATITEVYTVLQALGLRIHPDTTSIGRVEKGVDFSGVHYRPTGMTVSEASLSRRDQTIVRLYEQGASKERGGAYLRRWAVWACMGVAAAGCATPAPVAWINESCEQYDERMDTSGVRCLAWQNRAGEWVRERCSGSSVRYVCNEGGRWTKTEICSERSDCKAVEGGAVRDKSPSGWVTYCMYCHGWRGNGVRDAKYGGKLRDFRDGNYMNKKSDAELLKIIKKGSVTDGGKWQMSGYEDVLSDERAKAIVAYIRSLAVPKYEQKK